MIVSFKYSNAPRTAKSACVMVIRFLPSDGYTMITSVAAPRPRLPPPPRPSAIALSLRAANGVPGQRGAP